MSGDGKSYAEAGLGGQGKTYEEVGAAGQGQSYGDLMKASKDSAQVKDEEGESDA